MPHATYLMFFKGCRGSLSCTQGFSRTSSVYPSFSLHMRLQKASRRARRENLEEKLSQADQASAQGSDGALFRLVRSLAPKQHYRQIQLPGPLAELLSQKDEDQQFVDAVRPSWVRLTWQSVASRLACRAPDSLSEDALAIALSSFSSKEGSSAASRPHVVVETGCLSYHPLYSSHMLCSSCRDTLG